ncbi:MAG: hypothetical protein NTU98_06620 [Bacteroidetes bacterium]|nr:hypothetical protein [Bacteroidota bacterium]
MKKSIVIILVAIIAAGIFACSKKSSDDSSSTPSTLVGIWTRMYQGQTMTIVINADATYSGTWGPISLPTGIYTLSGNTFTVQDQECSNQGHYSYTLANNVLVLTLVSDICDGRYQMVPGTYNKK